MSVTDWVANKLRENSSFSVDGPTPENFLVVTWSGTNTFLVAVLGVQGIIRLSDIEPLFAGTTKPKLAVNVPSSTLWSGAAIDRIHAESAAFGTFGDVSRVAHLEDAGSYRDNDMGFFINAMSQHSNVSSVSYIYDRVFEVRRFRGTSLVVAVIDTYNMSAEDVRNARTRFGNFDVIVKSTSYGSITIPASQAAISIGAQALTFGELLARLAR